MEHHGVFVDLLTGNLLLHTPSFLPVGVSGAAAVCNVGISQNKMMFSLL